MKNYQLDGITDVERLSFITRTLYEQAGINPSDRESVDWGKLEEGTLTFSTEMDVSGLANRFSEMGLGLTVLR